MREKDIHYFIQTLKAYFLSLTQEEIVINIPFLKEPENVFPLEWNSLIGISGAAKGVVFFSSEKKLLYHLYKEFVLPEREPSPQELCDLLGEITNTIAGNMREFYGKDFLISVPITFVGKEMGMYIHIPRPLFVFPVSWRSFYAFFTVALEQ
ncbi:MAG: chemotaxis protein CheX [Brevinematales bacterium]|nr:chemotaxis protein CheX [Brevinematales bacterium]